MHQYTHLLANYIKACQFMKIMLPETTDWHLAGVNPSRRRATLALRSAWSTNICHDSCKPWSNCRKSSTDKCILRIIFSQKAENHGQNTLIRRQYTTAISRLVLVRLRSIFGIWETQLVLIYTLKKWEWCHTSHTRNPTKENRPSQSAIAGEAGLRIGYVLHMVNQMLVTEFKNLYLLSRFTVFQGANLRNTAKIIFLIVTILGGEQNFYFLAQFHTLCNFTKITKCEKTWLNGGRKLWEFIKTVQSFLLWWFFNSVKSIWFTEVS